MWDFLNNLLEKAGVVAVLFAVVMIAGGLVFRWIGMRYLAAEKSLAEKTTKLEKADEVKASAISELQAVEDKKRAEMRGAHEAQLREIIKSHDDEIIALHIERREAAENFAAKLETLQEKRLEELNKIVREVVTSATKTEGAMVRMADVLDLVKNAMLGR